MISGNGSVYVAARQTHGNTNASNLALGVAPVINSNGVAAVTISARANGLTSIRNFNVTVTNQLTFAVAYGSSNNFNIIAPGFGWNFAGTTQLSGARQCRVSARRI